MMTKSNKALIVCCLLAGCVTSMSQPSDTSRLETSQCQIGIFGDRDEFVSVTRRGDGFQYAYSDGRRGTIDESAPVECVSGAVRLRQTSEILSQIPLVVMDTTFDHRDATLAGQLLQPVDADGNTPLVVLAHGSEDAGWIESAVYPFQLVGRGVSVFVYDKRGTGRSTGTYSQNFPKLADDLVAASAEARRLAEDRYGRFGLLGFSQGGWIAPLATEASGAEFLGIGYGLVVDILEEDASQVELELREAGFGDDVIAKAKELTDVTARLAVSGYMDGLDDFDALKARYGQEDWFPRVKGGFTGVILGMSSDTLRSEGIPAYDRLDIDWSVKPLPVLRTVDVPQLWALAEDDREAPIETTLERLQLLRREGKDITLMVFPDTDHGLWEFERSPDGSRERTRVTNAYYDLLADWAKGELKPDYGSSYRR